MFRSRLMMIFVAVFALTNIAAFDGELTGEVSNIHWLDGKWIGTGYQVDGKTWEVDLEAQVDEKIIIAYPDLACSGVWNMTNNGKKKVKFTELILDGVNNCDQGVEVHVKKLDDNNIRVEYYLKWYSNEPIAEAVLKRVQPL